MAYATSFQPLYWKTMAYEDGLHYWNQDDLNTYISIVQSGTIMVCRSGRTVTVKLSGFPRPATGKRTYFAFGNYYSFAANTKPGVKWNVRPWTETVSDLAYFFMESDGTLMMEMLPATATTQYIYDQCTYITVDDFV